MNRSAPSPKPALSRYDRLRRTPTALLSEADKAYMEAYDLARAYPGCLEPIYQGLADALIASPSSSDDHDTP